MSTRSQAVQTMMKNPFLLLALFYLVHVAEELLFNFPAWATLHFGRTTQNFYLLSHIPITIAVLCISWLAYRSKKHHFLGVGVASILLVNGVLHAISAFIFQGYSPGLLTGVLLFTTGPILVFRYCLKTNSLSHRQIRIAFFIGMIISLFIGASLFLEMPNI